MTDQNPGDERPLLTPCPACGKNVSKNAAACPNCGNPVKKELIFEKAKQEETKQSVNPGIVEKRKKSLNSCLNIILWLLVVIVLYFIFTYKPEHKFPPIEPYPSSINSRQAIETYSFPIEITPHKLLTEYEENEVKADNLYRGKKLKIYGKVDAIGKDIADKPYITFDNRGENIFSSVQIYFTKEEQYKLSKLSKGQIVTITGICEGKFINILIKDSVFYNIEAIEDIPKPKDPDDRGFVTYKRLSDDFPEKIGNLAASDYTEILAAKAKLTSAVQAGITDGDTMRLVVDGVEIKVRLYGIDAPELSQAYGPEAAKALREMTTGRNLRISITDTDRYGRKVAVIFADDICVNQEMVVAGYAWVYRQDCKLASCAKWIQYEAQALEAGRGLWADEQAIPPWEWRHKDLSENRK